MAAPLQALMLVLLVLWGSRCLAAAEERMATDPMEAVEVSSADAFLAALRSAYMREGRKTISVVRDIALSSEVEDGFGSSAPTTASPFLAVQGGKCQNNPDPVFTVRHQA